MISYIPGHLSNLMNVACWTDLDGGNDTSCLQFKLALVFDSFGDMTGTTVAKGLPVD